VGNWYSIGVFVGFGVALGLAAASFLAGRRAGVPAAFVLAVAVAGALGLLLADWEEAIGGAAGGAVGAAGAGELVVGALRRGGTRSATAALLSIGAVVLAALALIPAVGYVEALALPVLGARLRRRAGGRYAGLRILARD
jgi:hypothetical protein